MEEEKKAEEEEEKEDGDAAAAAAAAAAASVAQPPADDARKRAAVECAAPLVLALVRSGFRTLNAVEWQDSKEQTQIATRTAGGLLAAPAVGGGRRKSASQFEYA